MDEVNIKSGFMQGIIVKIIRKVVKQKLGFSPELQFNDPIRVIFDGDKVKIHLNVDAELGKEELQSLLKGQGL